MHPVIPFGAPAAVPNRQPGQFYTVKTLAANANLQGAGEGCLRRMGLCTSLPPRSPAVGSTASELARIGLDTCIGRRFATLC